MYIAAPGIAQKKSAANRIGCVRSPARNLSALKRERRKAFFAKRRMSDDAAFLREQARRCRRLARGIATPDVVETLNRMASDYDTRADEMERRSR
jgi:hypothetical protein